MFVLSKQAAQRKYVRIAVSDSYPEGRGFTISRSLVDVVTGVLVHFRTVTRGGVGQKRGRRLDDIAVCQTFPLGSGRDENQRSHRLS
jgi:hypothetical protein